MNRTEELYLEWLYPLVVTPAARVENSGATYRELVELLYLKEFTWFVPNDDNRIGDAMDVRREFLRENNPRLNMTGEAMEHGCSVLEVIVGLSRRLEFMVGGDAPSWSWQLIANLGLERFRDRLGRRKADQTNDILDALINRNYSLDGSGGFFPLAYPKEDQRKVEIWYQMAAYVNEMQDL